MCGRAGVDVVLDGLDRSRRSCTPGLWLFVCVDVHVWFRVCVCVCVRGCACVVSCVCVDVCACVGDGVDAAGVSSQVQDWPVWHPSAVYKVTCL